MRDSSLIDEGEINDIVNPCVAESWSTFSRGRANHRAKMGYSNYHRLMGSKGGRYLAMASLLLAALLLSGCSAHQDLSAQPPSPSAGGSRLPKQSASASGTPGSIDHIVIIVEENESSAKIIGNNAAPYINSLATEFALADNYYAVTHPSLPNYLALTSGTTAGITNDCNPPGGSCQARVRSIADEITQSGRTWKMYAESMPAACTANNSGYYAVKHNPFMYYPSVTDDSASCRAHVVPFTQFGADLKDTSTLPDYAFISPNLCNDMHDCSVPTGDTWLSREVPNILASPAFTEQRSLLIITWDEGDSGSNRVVTIFAGPAAKRAYKTGTPYSHYSLLHTIENAWDLPPLTSNDKNAPLMNELLQ